MTQLELEFMKTDVNDQIRFLLEHKYGVSKIELDNDSTIVYFNGEDKWFGLSNYLGNSDGVVQLLKEIFTNAEIELV